ncbi:hypothetical protein GCM10007190_06770 [Macrococcus hajekii]|nr:hypothetical protein [Macrococcus hajekii]GGB01350.1 hypothetical protein GCM10007190_06770 [Macrococcus hajekii]
MTEENKNVEEVKEERVEKRFEQDAAAEQQNENTEEVEKKNFI